MSSKLSTEHDTIKDYQIDQEEEQKDEAAREAADALSKLRNSLLKQVTAEQQRIEEEKKRIN